MGSNIMLQNNECEEADDDEINDKLWEKLGGSDSGYLKSLEQMSANVIANTKIIVDSHKQFRNREQYKFEKNNEEAAQSKLWDAKELEKLQTELIVVCRVRDSVRPENRPFLVSDDKMQIAIAQKSKSKKQDQPPLKFTFDRVFDYNVSIDDISKNIKGIILNCMKNKTAVLISYGGPKSGRSAFMRGRKDAHGLVYRIAERLMETIQWKEKEGYEFFVKASNFEICDTKIYDMLAGEEDFKPHAIKLRTSSEKEFEVTNLTEVEVLSANEIFKSILPFSTKSKTVSVTKSKDRTSTAHWIFRLKLSGRCTQHEDINSSILFIDLEGKKHLQDYMDEFPNEPVYGNWKTDNALKTILNMVYQKPNMTILFAHVSQEEKYFDNSVKTLTFASDLLEKRSAENSKFRWY